MTTAPPPPSRPRRRYRATAIGLAATLLAVGVLVFWTIDVSGAAEPSWLERELAFGLLQARIGLGEATPRLPVTLADSEIKRSSEVYQQRCAFCHGGIAGGAAAFARTMSPRPPQFLTQPPRGSVAMDAYIIQHGIRWTGMPAFRSMSDADAWRLALLVHQASSHDTHDALAALVSDPLFGFRPFLAGVSVPNAREAADWYRDKLGFTENGATTDRNGLQQIVVEHGSYAIELLEIKDSRQGLIKLGFVVDDLDPVLRGLTQQGVHIVRGITALKAFQVRFILIEDSNGNVIQIFDRKSA